MYKRQGSKLEEVRVYALVFDGESGALGALVIPYVHPGPFKTLGSSTLPSLLMSRLRERGVPTLALHGASGHERNLVFRRDSVTIVERVEEAVLSGIGRHVEVSPFYRLRSGRIACLAQSLDGVLLALISCTEGGMEDLPYDLVAEGAKVAGSELLLVDAHNRLEGDSPRPMPGTRLYEEILEVLARASEVDVQRYGIVRAGFYSAPLERWREVDGIGAGGAAAAVFEIGGRKYFLLVYDANNMLAPMRDEIVAHLSAELGIDDGEVLTTDTHSVAGAVPGKQYAPLGERVKTEELLEVAREFVRRALEGERECTARLVEMSFELPVMGAEAIARLSALVSRGLGAFVLFVIGASILGLASLLF